MLALVLGVEVSVNSSSGFTLRWRSYIFISCFFHILLRAIGLFNIFFLLALPSKHLLLYSTYSEIVFGMISSENLYKYPLIFASNLTYFPYCQCSHKFASFNWQIRAFTLTCKGLLDHRKKSKMEMYYEYSISIHMYVLVLRHMGIRSFDPSFKCSGLC